MASFTAVKVAEGGVRHGEGPFACKLWWLRLQVDHDTRIAKTELAKELELIKPLRGSP